VLGPEVVHLRTTGDAGAFGDPRRRRPRVAVLDQAVDGGVEQPHPHLTTALLLSAARGLGECGSGHSADSTFTCRSVCSRGGHEMRFAPPPCSAPEHTHRESGCAAAGYTSGTPHDVRGAR